MAFPSLLLYVERYALPFLCAQKSEIILSLYHYEYLEGALRIARNARIHDIFSFNQ